MKKLRILISLLMLGAAACVLFGKSIVYGPGFTITYDYITALIPKDGVGWRQTTYVLVWVLLISGVGAAVLVWLKPMWATIVTLILCLCPVVWHFIASIINHYNAFGFSGITDTLMLLLPFAASICSILLIRARKNAV